MLVSYDGIKIIPSNYWPQIRDGDEKVRYSAHPIIHWLAKYFPIDQWVEATYPKYKDADPVIDNRNNALYCSMAQFRQIERELK